MLLQKPIYPQSSLLWGIRKFIGLQIKTYIPSTRLYFEVFLSDFKSFFWLSIIRLWIKSALIISGHFVNKDVVDWLTTYHIEYEKMCLCCMVNPHKNYIFICIIFRHNYSCIDMNYFLIRDSFIIFVVVYIHNSMIIAMIWNRFGLVFKPNASFQVLLRVDKEKLGSKSKPI